MQTPSTTSASQSAHCRVDNILWIRKLQAPGDAAGFAPCPIVAPHMVSLTLGSGYTRFRAKPPGRCLPPAI
jgi:hypothetical protein